MRLSNFTAAVTIIFSVAAPVANAFFGDIKLPPELIPDECRPTFQIAHEQGVMFDKWLMDNVCRDYKVSYAQVKDNIDRVVMRYLKYVWARVNPPVDLEKEVWPFYRELKKECIMQPQWGVVNNPDFCGIKNGDRKLTEMVNHCIIPKVAAKYTLRIATLSEWVAKNCHKLEAIVREVLVNTKGKQQYLSFVINARIGRSKSQ